MSRHIVRTGQEISILRRTYSTFKWFDNQRWRCKWIRCKWIECKSPPFIYSVWSACFRQNLCFFVFISVLFITIFWWIVGSGFYKKNYIFLSKMKKIKMEILTWQHIVFLVAFLLLLALLSVIWKSVGLRYISVCTLHWAIF